MTSNRLMPLISLIMVIALSFTTLGRALEMATGNEEVYSLPPGKVGETYEFRIQTEGGLAPLTWKVTGGQIPPGLELLPTGIIRGVPATAQSQPYAFEVEVSDSSQPPQTFAQRLVLMIKAAPLRIVTNQAPLKIVPPSQSAATSPLAPPARESESAPSNAGLLSARVAGERVSNESSPRTAPSSPSPPTVRGNRSESVAVDGSPADQPPAPTIKMPVEGAKFIYGTATPGATVKIFVQQNPGTVDETRSEVWSGTADDKGKFAAELDNPLIANWYVSALQVVNNEKGVMSTQQQVRSTLYDWGRVRAYFTANVIFSKERDEFSQQDLGIGFNLDKNWHWGRQVNFNTYFEASLTSIPVKAQEGTTETTPTPPPSDTEIFLASKKAAILQGGAYLPLSRKSWIWQYGGEDNALFIAPIVKAGFQTITNGQKTAESEIFGQDDVFHFHSYGVRLGHFKLSSSENVAHELISYLDITPGKWENFEVVNKNGDRKRQRRLGVEGRLKIPATPLLVGFDANLGNGKDDLRFVFGTRFDIGELLGKLKFLQQR